MGGRETGRKKGEGWWTEDWMESGKEGPGRQRKEGREQKEGNVGRVS
jgi:hypothetical protein